MTAPSFAPSMASSRPSLMPTTNTTICEELPRDSVMTEKLLEVTGEEILLDADTPQGRARLWLIDRESVRKNSSISFRLTTCSWK